MIEAKELFQRVSRRKTRLKFLDIVQKPVLLTGKRRRQPQKGQK
jgi:hypothetical protein